MYVIVMDVGGKQLFSLAAGADWQCSGLHNDSVDVAGGSLISCNRDYLRGTNSSLPPICVSEITSLISVAQ